MSIQSIIYHTIYKRTSTFMVAIVGGAFMFERALDIGAHALFDSYNRGKQWKDIKHKYEK